MNKFEILDQASRSETHRCDLTVVVPTSNTAAYLPACLSSVSNQNGLRIELIVVDYKSDDASLDIVREFAHNNPDILVTIVRQNTPGLGDARNFGLEIAKGEFIAFLDSDDFFAPDTYAVMVRYARSHSCDLVFCRAMVFDDITNKLHPFYDDWVWDDILGKRYCLTTRAVNTPQLFKFEPNACLRLMRREFMLEQDIRYPEGKRAEDIIPHYRSLFEAKRIGLVSRRGLFYRIGREGKLTSNPVNWIGDLVEAINSAIAESNHYAATPEIGSAMVYLFVRTLFIYGTKLPFEMRAAYYRLTSLLFCQLPKSWSRIALANQMHPHIPENVRISLALKALISRDIDFLLFWSGSPRSLIGVVVAMIRRPRMVFTLLQHYGILGFLQLRASTKFGAGHD